MRPNVVEIAKMLTVLAHCFPTVSKKTAVAI